MMKIKTAKEIVSETRGKSLSDLSVEPYEDKYVAVEDILEEIKVVLDTDTKGLTKDMIIEHLVESFKVLEIKLEEAQEKRARKV